MKYKAEHDALTGVLNRSGFDNVTYLLENEQFPLAFALVDVDSFKSVNDTYGHEIGDKILFKTSKILSSSFRSSDIVSRIGGDEFVVIITGNTKEFQSIIESFDRRVAQWHGKLVDSMTISWGYVFSSEKEWDNIYDIAKEADERMYKNKERYYQESKIVRRR